MRPETLYRNERAAQWRILTEMNVQGYRINRGTRFAAAAWDKAKTDAEFFERECGEHDEPCIGDVRLQWVPDDHCDMDDLKGDCFNRSVNPEIQESRMAREEKAFEEKVEREGVWGLVGEVFNGRTWEHADSVWGFVGQDAHDYEQDIKRETLRASDKILMNS